jgi:hypothetical protein
LGGTLINSGGALNSGGLFISAPNQTTAALSAAGFTNSDNFSVFSVFGGDSSGHTGHATATFGGLAPSTLTGRITLTGDASVQFTGGGTIDSIANGTRLTVQTWAGFQPLLTGLSGLTSNAGTLALDTAIVNASYVGGMNLTFSNTITNTGTILFGPSGRVPDLVTMAGLNNTGTLIVNGAVTLNVLGPAPNTLTGDNFIAGGGVLQYGSGSFTAIGSGAVLDLNGSSRVALSGQPGNGALAHLSSNAGGLHLRISGGIATDTDFSNTNFIRIEQGTLALGGALNNSGIFHIGFQHGSFTPGGVLSNSAASPGIFASVSATALNNTGNLTLETLGLPGEEAMTLSISGNASNTGTLSVDGTADTHDSVFSVGGVLSNSGTLTLGSGAPFGLFATNIATTTASGFVNSGTTRMAGSAANQMAAFTVNGNVSNSGSLSIGQFATLSVSSGNAFTQTAGTTTINGGLSADQLNIGGGSLVFQTPLTSAAHTGPMTLSGGSFVEFGSSVDSSEQVGFDGPGIIRLDIGSQFAGTIFHFMNAGDAVAITDLSDASNDAHTSFNPATNQLTVFGDNGAVTLQLDAENYSGVSWSTQRDGTGGTFVSASFAAGSQYVFFAPGQPINVTTTTNPKNVPPPVPGAFNLAVIVNATGTGSYTTASGY